MSVLSDYDVNIFFPEYVDPVSGVTELLPTMVVAVCEYHAFNGVSFSTGTTHRFILDAEETALVASGCADVDWWECAEDFVNAPYCPARVKAGLLTLPAVVKLEGE